MISTRQAAIIGWFVLGAWAVTGLSMLGSLVGLLWFWR